MEPNWLPLRGPQPRQRLIIGVIGNIFGGPMVGACSSNKGSSGQAALWPILTRCADSEICCSPWLICRSRCVTWPGHRYTQRIPATDAGPNNNFDSMLDASKAEVSFLSQLRAAYDGSTLVWERVRCSGWSAPHDPTPKILLFRS